MAAERAKQPMTVRTGPCVQLPNGEPLFTKDQVSTALCIWDHFRDAQQLCHLHDTSKEGENLRTPTDGEVAIFHAFNQTGSAEMRDRARELVYDVDRAWDELVRMGFDPEVLSPFDFEFVPAILEFVDWKNGSAAFNGPEALAKLLAVRALIPGSQP